MARRLSRRQLAGYVAAEIIADNKKAAITQLAAYLVEQRRTKEVALLLRDVASQLAEQGQVTGTVTTAHDLTEETKAAIDQFVKQATGASTVALELKQNPAVLGGVKIALPGKEIDRTVARQLTILTTRFKKA